VIKLYDELTLRLQASGQYVWPMALRLIMAWEFWEAGLSKLNGENWFAQIPWADWQKGFPIPFSLISTELNWLLATWAELIFAAMLLLGLFTRFAAVSLIVVTSVATAAVHWPAEWNSLGELWNGYVITSDGGGNFKLPLLFVIMLLPLVFNGAGKLSIDHLLVGLSGRHVPSVHQANALFSAGLVLLVLGLASVWVEPSWGISLLIAAALAILIPSVRGNV